MGTCVSRPENCVGGKFGGSRKKRSRKRRKALKRRLHSHPSNRSLDRVDKFPSLPLDRTAQGSLLLLFHYTLILILSFYLFIYFL